MKLSIVCPALVCRRESSKILGDVERQCVGRSAELIVLSDNAQITIGEKMNHLYAMARGEYIATIADDDDVSEVYVERILRGIDTLVVEPDDRLGVDGLPDVVTFDVDWQAGERFMDWKPSTCDLRPLAAVRSTLAKRFQFPDWWQSEDRAFRVWLSALEPAVHHIDQILYYYNFRASKPEFGGGMYPPGGKMASASEVAKVVRSQL